MQHVGAPLLLFLIANAIGVLVDTTDRNAAGSIKYESGTVEPVAFSGVDDLKQRKDIVMATKALDGSNKNVEVGDLSEQIATLRNDLGALTQTIADLGRSKGDEAIAAAKSKAYDARDAAAEKAEAARVHALQLQEQANDFVRRQPATALGIAAGLGFLVGFMGSRK